MPSGLAEKPLILLADDNRVNRLVIRSTFKSYDYEFIEAVNGVEAVRLAEEKKPDLILMDLMMPEMDGLEATRRLKEDPETARIPILMLTALNESEDRIQAFDAGAMAFVSKPFDRLELLAHVRSYLSFSLINKKYILSTANPTSGLPNRAAFREALADAEAEPWLLLLKMDDLEAVTRLYGEIASADMERSFGEFLRSVTEEALPTARLYHLNPGIFGFLLEVEEADRVRSLERATSIVDRLSGHESTIEGVPHRHDYTAVVAVGKERILERAELALEKAAVSKGGIAFADDLVPIAHKEFADNLFWLARIREAVDEDQIIPHFQPIAETATGRVAKYEALARIQTTDGSISSPGQFMRVAKNSRYYPDITRTIIEKSLAVFRRRPEDLSVNLSVLDIEHEETRTLILETLEQDPDLARRLTLEIVEQEGIQHFSAIKEFVDQVRKHGASLAIDDFGSGYSNFKTVVDLNIDYLKVDGSIIQRVCDDPVVSNLLEVIKSFAESAGLRLIAEFVDSQEILDYLSSRGIEFVQGYHIGKPIPLE